MKLRSRISGEELPGEFPDSTEDQIQAALSGATASFRAWDELGGAGRADRLEQLAVALEKRAEPIIERAHHEAGLPVARFQGELGRTVGQIRFQAGVARRGDWEDERIDAALPERTPPRPEVRSRMRPLGPVLVFGASNFPLAFSTAGGDTISALAAGCPVIHKAHPAHAGVCTLVGEAFTEVEIPFWQLFGGAELGARLAEDPAIQAIGFTGSRRGGLALREIAHRRGIPIFAEMSSVNPSVILPSAQTEATARGLAASATLGVGQFCTNPGLVFLVEGPSTDEFLKTFHAATAAVAPVPMLTEGIAEAYRAGTARLGSEAAEGAPSCFVFDRFRPELADEVFGPCTVFVRLPSASAVQAALATLEGQLTASLHAAPEEATADWRWALERIAGRVLLNQFPTGVEVVDAMVHGGPFPATSAPGTTSVGGRAIARWARPVAYQGWF